MNESRASICANICAAVEEQWAKCTSLGDASADDGASLVLVMFWASETKLQCLSHQVFFPAWTELRIKFSE